MLYEFKQNVWKSKKSLQNVYIPRFWVDLTLTWLHVTMFIEFRKKQQRRIVSTDAEKSFDKNQNLFIIQNLEHIKKEYSK